ITMRNNKSTYRIATVLTAVLLFTGFAASAESNSNPGVLPPQSHPHGATYEEWSARWWQWALAIPALQSPILDHPYPLDCAANQSGPVWFLTGTAGGAVTRYCTVPAGVAILFPIVNYENDYPCPDPNFQPAPGQSLQD